MFTKLVELARAGKFGKDGDVLTEEMLKQVSQSYQGKCPIYSEHPDVRQDLDAVLGHVSYVFFDDAKKSLLGILEIDSNDKSFQNRKSWSIALKREHDNSLTLDHLALTNHPKIKGLKTFSQTNIESNTQESDAQESSKSDAFMYFSSLSDADTDTSVNTNTNETNISFSDSLSHDSLQSEFLKFKDLTTKAFKKLGIDIENLDAGNIEKTDLGKTDSENDTNNPNINQTVNQAIINQNDIEKILNLVMNSSLPKELKDKIEKLSNNINEDVNKNKGDNGKKEDGKDVIGQSYYFEIIKLLVNFIDKGKSHLFSEIMLDRDETDGRLNEGLNFLKKL